MHGVQCMHICCFEARMYLNLYSVLFRHACSFIEGYKKKKLRSTASISLHGAFKASSQRRGGGGGGGGEGSYILLRECSSLEHYLHMHMQ